MTRRKKYSRREIALMAQARSEGTQEAADAVRAELDEIRLWLTIGPDDDIPAAIRVRLDDREKWYGAHNAQRQRAEEAERQVEVRREIIDSASRTLSLAGHPEASGSLGARTEWLASERDAERREHEGWKKIAEERWAERKLLLAELAAAQAELVAQIGETNDVSRSRRRIADYLMGLDAIVRAAGASTASGLAWAILQRFPPKKPA